MAFVLGLTFVVLVVSFRSVVVAATAVVLNLLSVATAYGLLVLVFQHGVGEDLLGFEGNGTVINWLPLFLFVVLFGLLMDHHVFVVSRVREAYLSGLPTKAAVAHGVTASAGVVTSAAAVMVGVFSIFGTLSLLEFKQLGLGLAAAVLIDATIVRAVLLPAAMTVLGRHPAVVGDLPPDLQPCTPTCAHSRAVPKPTRPAPLRPAARRCLDVAQFRGTRSPGRRLGRSQRQRPAPGLRQVHRRLGSHLTRTHRTLPAVQAGRCTRPPRVEPLGFSNFGAHHGRTAVDSHFRPVIAGQHAHGP